MKRLLTIFSAFVLGGGSAFGVASCTARGKHERDDKDESDHNQDLAILNDITQEVKQTFKAWWVQRQQLILMIIRIKDHFLQI